MWDVILSFPFAKDHEYQLRRAALHFVVVRSSCRLSSGDFLIITTGIEGEAGRPIIIFASLEDYSGRLIVALYRLTIIYCTIVTADRTAAEGGGCGRRRLGLSRHRLH